MKRVLCAVDLSDVSMDVLHYAQAIVQGYRGCLTVLHVVPTLPRPRNVLGGGIVSTAPICGHM